MGNTMVGTTDVKCDVTHFCQPTQEEIDFMIEELKPYVGESFDYKNKLVSAWAGIRPLVTADQVEKTEFELAKQ